MKTPGVGFRLSPGAPVCTEDGDSRNRRCAPINLDAHPFGPNGTSPHLDRAELGRRYAGGPANYPSHRQPIGLWADEQGGNIAALEHWFSVQPESHRRQWTGTPTTEEWYDLAHSESRRGSDFYERHWFSVLPGGTPGTPRVVVKENFSGHAWRFKPQTEERFRLERRLGTQTVQGLKGQTIWFDVRWFPGIDAPPPPDPEPEPEPTPGRATPRRRAEEWHETGAALLVQAKAAHWTRRLWWVGREPFLAAAEALITAKRRVFG